MKRANNRGFTLIEVMMAMSVMTIGALGIMSMQQASTRGNMSARQMTVASQSTQLWLDRTRRDAVGWNQPNVAAIAGTSILSNLPAAGSSGWFTPAPTMPGESAGFDWFGNEVALAQGRYCTQLNLTWVISGQLVRVDARTWWHRRGNGDGDTSFADGTLFPNCGTGSEAAVTGELETSAAPRLHSVYASTLVRWRRVPN